MYEILTFYKSYLELVNVTVLKNISIRCKKMRPMRILKTTIPLFDWLSTYNWKNDILGDIVAGITVAVMHIPQGKYVCKRFDSLVEHEYLCTYIRLKCVKIYIIIQKYFK